MNKVNSLLVAAVVAIGIVAFYLWQQLHEERQASSALRTAQPASLPEVQRQQPLTGTSSLASEPVVTPEPPASAAKPMPDPKDAVAYDIEVRKRNPNYIGVVQGKSAQMQLRFPDLARELGMSPAEAEALYDLLVKQQQELASLPRYSGNDEALKREAQRVSDEMLRKQKAELNAKLAGRQQQWKDYQGSLDARRRVSELTNMVATTSPLSEQQSRLLVSTVVAEQQRRANEQAALGKPADNPQAQLAFEEQSLKARMESNRRTIEAARAYLTEQQVTIMQNAMDGLNRNMRLMLERQRAQLESGGGAAGP